MSKIAVLTDSGSRITPEQAKELGIYVLPLQVVVNGKGYNEGIDIDAEKLFSMMQENAKLVPTTSQPSTGIIIEIIEQIKKDGYDKILAITMGKGLSATHDNLIAQGIANDIEMVVISSDAGGPIEQHLVKLAKAKADAGESIEEIESRLRELVADSETFMVANDLAYLKRSGRLTATAAMVVGMLKIKPLLILRHDLGGMVDTFAKVRSIRKAAQIVINHMIEKGVNGKDYDVYLPHAWNEEDVKLFQETVLESFPGISIEIPLLPAAIGANLGLKGFGLQYIKKQ